MRFQFDDYAVENKRLGNGALRMDILEAMEGEGPDGRRGIVGTGNSMTLVMTEEVALNHVIDIAITMGWMKDQDRVDVATVTDLTEEIQKRRKKQEKKTKRRPKKQ
jgi:hypothetical protein